MKRLSFLFLFFALTNMSLWADLDLRLGGNVSFSTLDLVAIRQVANSLGNDCSQHKVEDLRRAINTACAGIQYGLYTQIGGAWDIFQAGGELAFSFSLFRDSLFREQLSSVMVFSPKAFMGFDLFLARLTLLAGMSFPFEVGKNPLIKNYNRPRLDLGFRLGVGPLVAELIGSLNTKDICRSLLRVGLGLEFTILGG